MQCSNKVCYETVQCHCLTFGIIFASGGVNIYVCMVNPMFPLPYPWEHRTLYNMFIIWHVNLGNMGTLETREHRAWRTLDPGNMGQNKRMTPKGVGVKRIIVDP